MKKLIPAVVMLLISAVVLSTASYAWFTISDDVEATGMSVTASAPTAILIATKAGQAFASSASVATDPQTSYKLYAASSPDGKVFYSPDQCTDLSGSAVPGTAFNVVNNAAGSGTQYYKDFEFTVRNTSPDASTVLEVKDIEIDGNAIVGAVRIAVIVTRDGAEVGTYLYNPCEFTSGPDDAGWVLVNGTPASGPIQDKIDAVTSGALDAWNTAAAGEDTYNEVTDDLVTLGPVTQDPDTNTAVYDDVDITVRVWFEGQSAACITSYAGQSAAISITFQEGTAD